MRNPPGSTGAVGAMAEGPKILLFVPHYPPSFKYGGPTKSVRNIVEALGQEYEFYVVSADREFGEHVPLSTVVPNVWQQHGSATVFYASPGFMQPRRLWSLMQERDFDVIYLNSLFHYRFSILPALLHRAGAAGTAKLLIAPRGELSAGALRIRRTKKKLFIGLGRLLQIYIHANWHAASAQEAEDIERNLGVPPDRVVVVPNVTDPVGPFDPDKATRSERGRLRLVYLSRVTPKKNLRFAVEALTAVRSDVEFDIYGPVDDAGYWRACQKEMAKLPENVTATYRGAVPPDRVGAILQSYDLLIFPTLAENFGHVVPEALGHGVPVLISDQTPWRELARRRVGWDISLHDPRKFSQIIDEVAQYNAAEKAALGASARAFAFHASAHEKAVAGTKSLLESLVTH